MNMNNLTKMIKFQTVLYYLSNIYKFMRLNKKTYKPSKHSSLEKPLTSTLINLSEINIQIKINPKRAHIQDTPTPIYYNHQQQVSPNTVNYLTDKSTTTRMQTNKINDSVRPFVTADHIRDWKILTVRELVNSKTARINNDIRSIEKNGKGLKLSIGKAKRKQVSKQKRQNLSMSSKNKINLFESEGNFQQLRKLSRNHKMIEKIEMETGNNSKIIC